MPVQDEANVVTLGEGMTPLLCLASLEQANGFERLYVKEEGLNPTGSFKARGLSAAVSKAQELGVKSVAIPSAGNAAGALAAYGAAAGMQTYVFMPEDAPEINKVECAICGAHVYLVKGLISDAGKIVKTLGPGRGWFDISILQEWIFQTSIAPERRLQTFSGALVHAGYFSSTSFCGLRLRTLCD